MILTRSRIVLLLGLILVLSGIICNTVFELVILSRHDGQFDVTCGRTRFVNRILWWQTSEDVHETHISQMYRQCVGEPPEPEWHTMDYTAYFGFSGIIADGVYQDAFSASEDLFRTLENRPFPNAAKRQALLTFFKLLQEDDWRDRAEEYVKAVDRTVAKRPFRSLEAEDLPEPPAPKASG